MTSAIDVVTSGGGDEEEQATDHVAVSYYRTDRAPNENAPPACAAAPGADMPWSDTRNAVAVQFDSPTLQGVTHHEDVSTTAQPVPSGHGEQD